MASAARVSGSPWKQCTPCSRTHLCPKRTHFSLLGCRWHGKEKLLHEKEEEKQNNSPRPSPHVTSVQLCGRRPGDTFYFPLNENENCLE